MKNYTTPRTLADCEFRTGYSDAFERREASRAKWDLAMLLLAILFVLGMAGGLL